MYVDWPTKVIKVFKTDMVLVDPGPPKEIYQLDTDWFRLQLRSLEDDEDGMAWPITHNHNTTVEVSGAILARVVEIINGYTVEFEDGQYAVNLVGSNNNIGDVTVVNQVSVRSSNSAGLQDLNSLQAASFGGAVTLKPSSIYSGQVFPVGTRAFPVNNEADAAAIAASRGLHIVNIVETMTLSYSGWQNGLVFLGDNAAVITLTVDTAANVTNSEFRNLTVAGVLDGGNVIRDCAVVDINYVNGYMHQCAIGGTITLGGGVQASILDCYSNVAGGGSGQYARIDFNGAEGNSLAIRNYSGGLDLRNKTDAAGDISIDMASGRIVIEDTVNAGTLYLRGVGIWQNRESYAGGATVINQLIDGTLIQTLDYSAFAERVHVDVLNGTAGTTYPIGTPGQPTDNLADAVTIANNQGLEIIDIHGDITITAVDNITGFTVVGHSPSATVVTVQSGATVAGCTFSNCTVEGVFASPRRFHACIFNDVTGDTVGAVGRLIVDSCWFTGTVTLSSSLQGEIHLLNCGSGVPTVGSYPVFDANGADVNVLARNYVGGMEVRNFNRAGGKEMTLDFLSGELLIASSCTTGNILVGGIVKVTDNSAGTAVTDQTVSTTVNTIETDVDAIQTVVNWLKKIQRGSKGHETVGSELHFRVREVGTGTLLLDHIEKDPTGQTPVLSGNGPVAVEGDTADT